MMQVTGKAVQDVVRGLKEQPLALPLVIVNLLVLGVIAYVLHEISERTAARDALIMELAKRCAS